MRRSHGIERVHGVRGLSFYRPPVARLERDLITPITRPRLLPLPLPPPVMRVDLRPISDRRLYHPLGAVRPALSLSGNPHRLVYGRNSKVTAVTRWPVAAVAFHAPKRVVICVRRKRRKEVIFALGRAGRGGSFRKPRRNFYSSVECR